jgi:hypothetical protein
MPTSVGGIVYLQRAGVPQSPADLAAHSLIVGPAGVNPGNWSFGVVDNP